MYGLDVSGMPTLHSYDAALRRYNETKPIRGRADDVRPLGPRSKTHVTIGKYEASGDVYVRLHHTNVLTYHADGKLTINTGGWDSPSTFALINHVAPWWVHMHTYGGKTWLRAYHGADHRLGDFWLKDRVATFEQRDTFWHILDPVPFSVRRIDRKGMNRLRKLFKPLYDYVDGYIKLMWTDYDGPHAARLRKGMEEYRTHLCEPTDDPEILMRMMCRAAYQFCAPTYVYTDVNPKLADASRYCIRREYIDKMLRAQFPDMAYTTTELPLGVKGKNIY